MKILVLAGGKSTENEVSLKSGDNVERALKEEGFDVLRADPADDAFDFDGLIKQVDMVFPILHGTGGEDGELQANLEQAGVPFLGSGSAASALTFDKAATKQCLAEKGIPTPKWQVVDSNSFSDSEIIKNPFVLKPIAGGSSIDTFIVHDLQIDLSEHKQVLNKYGTMLLEELIEGQELTVGVLDDQPMPVILIVPPTGEEFDFENKYNGKSQEITDPSSIPIELQLEAQQLALEVHHLTGCRHMSRTDIMLTPNGELYVLETNTIPGLTSQSLYPKAAQAHGLDNRALVRRLVDLVNHSV